MQKSTLKISGMNCASCAKIIEFTLQEKNGVNSAGVNYDSGKALLEFDQQKTNISEIKKEIETLGYKVSE